MELVAPITIYLLLKFRNDYNKSLNVFNNTINEINHNITTNSVIFNLLIF